MKTIKIPVKIKKPTYTDVNYIHVVPTIPDDNTELKYIIGALQHISETRNANLIKVDLSHDDTIYLTLVLHYNNNTIPFDIIISKRCFASDFFNIFKRQLDNGIHDVIPDR